MTKGNREDRLDNTYINASASDSAEQNDIVTTNSQNAHGDNTVAAVKIGRQYIKSISFNNLWNTEKKSPANEQPKITFNFEYGTNKLADNIFEVLLKLNAKCTLGLDNIYDAELVYAGTFIAQNESTRGLQGLLMVDCPHLLFPTAAFLFNTVIREAGHAPLTLNSVNFAALYRQQLAKQQEKNSATTAETTAGQGKEMN